MSSPYSQQLLEFIAALQVPYLFERSFKMTAGHFYGDRFLVSLYMPALRDSANGSLAEQQLVDGLADVLHMPASYRKAVATQLSDVQELHIGFERQGRQSLAKVYIEQPWHANATDKQLMHRAYKWSIEAAESSDEGSELAAIAEYYRMPVQSRSDIVQGVIELSASLKDEAGRELIKATLDKLLSLDNNQLSLEQLCYLQVQEQGNQRSSCDIKFYDAEVKMFQLKSLLQSAAEYFAVPLSLIDNLLTAEQDQILGHWSAGVGRNEQAFMSFYYGVKSY